MLHTTLEVILQYIHFGRYSWNNSLSRHTRDSRRFDSQQGFIKLTCRLCGQTRLFNVYRGYLPEDISAGSWSWTLSCFQRFFRQIVELYLDCLYMILYRAQSLIYVKFDRNVYVLTVWLGKAPHHLVSLLWNYIYLQIKEKLPKLFFFNSTPFKPQGRE